ncbi:IclR family transcriptional regulator [Maledivibacter halophilus]|uniref:Transcriptional regulator, IclR family n=1 Tax=Maledivibacter halophilus TaxID=36842 RepID=A0A1T5MA30_9FIRM|nr:IclR family transcriptional regulator [Maledivibacter halophilus]SKC84963.1 transcriptional regulator, IclR family [Maledivibacter halophilus]
MGVDKLSSLEKSIEIMKYLAKEPYCFSALELSRALNINRSTVHRILSTLKNNMIVLQSPSNKKYKIGPMAYHVGSAYINKTNNMNELISIVDEVSEKLKMSTGYSIIENGKIINIYENELYTAIGMGYKPGSFYPIHCGAYGKTIMAFYEPLEELKEIVYNAKLEKRTENTITDPKTLLQEYTKIRKKGYTISDGENIPGAIGIGAPVENSKGRVIGSIATAGIKESINLEKLEMIKELIIDAARKISKHIP